MNPHEKRMKKLTHSRRTISRRKFACHLISQTPQTSEIGFMVTADNIMFQKIPTHYLRDAGIVIVNQPFEIEEQEIVDWDGSFIIVHTFRKNSTTQQAFKSSLKPELHLLKRYSTVLKRYDDISFEDLLNL